MINPPKEYVVYWTSQTASKSAAWYAANNNFKANSKSFTTEDKALLFLEKLTALKEKEELFQMRKIHHICPHVS
jgi:hypothetical protein